MRVRVRERERVLARFPPVEIEKGARRYDDYISKDILRVACPRKTKDVLEDAM